MYCCDQKVESHDEGVDDRFLFVRYEHMLSIQEDLKVENEMIRTMEIVHHVVEINFIWVDNSKKQGRIV